MELNVFKKLRDLLEQVSDTYDNFVMGIMDDCIGNEDHAQALINFIEEHSQANSSDISEFHLDYIGVPWCDDNEVWHRWNKIITEEEAQRIAQEKYCDN